MDIRNCVMCGCMFQYVGDKVCPKCKKAMEEKLQEVKEYINSHDRVTVMQVSEELDVPVKQIRRWIQEERLMFAPGIDTGLVCQKCGMPIESGTMCTKCKERLKNAFEEVHSTKRTARSDALSNLDNKGKMHLTRFK